MSLVTIHQPCYIPYLGVFYKVWKSDKFVYLDDAQYSSGYVFDWNRIKTSSGECRLKIPLERKFGDLLTEVKPKDFLLWKEKHLKTIEMNYKRAPYYKVFMPDFTDCIMEEYGSLSELNIAVMNLFMEKFGWKKKIYRSSDMNISSLAETRVIDIVLKAGGDSYLSGMGGKNYQSEEHFIDAGIKLIYTDYVPVNYKQLWGSFVPNLSVIDYVLNEGYEIDILFDKVKEHQNEEQ